MSVDLLKSPIKSLCITILATGIACNIFLIIPFAIDHKAVDYFNRYYQDVLSALLCLCIIVLLFTSIKKRNAADERRNDRAAIGGVAVVDHQQGGEIPAGPEKSTGSRLVLFAVFISGIGGLSCILLAVGKWLMYKFGCYSIILIDINLPGFIGKFYSDLVFICASCIFFVVCLFYIRHLSKILIDIDDIDRSVYYFINLFLTMVIWLQFAKMVSFEAEDNFNRLIKSSHNHTIDDCYFYNRTTDHSTALYKIYPYVEKFAFSFAVKSLPVLFLIIEDLKKNHRFEHHGARIQLQVPDNIFMNNSRVILIAVIVLGVLVLLSSSVVFSIIFWSNNKNGDVILAKSGLTSISYVLLSAIAYFMLSSINYDNLNNQQIAITWNNDPDVLILMYSFLPVVFYLGCSFIAGWITLFSPTHAWYTISAVIFYTIHQFCELIEGWMQYYLAKWMIIVNEQRLTSRPSPVIVFGSFVFVVTNTLFAIDTLVLMTHFRYSTTPLSSLLNVLASAIMISITLPANVLFRSRLVGMFVAFFWECWCSFIVDCFEHIKNSCRRYRILP